MAQYESEFTKFMREMMDAHPEWLEDRVVGRSLLWDKKVDLDEQAVFRDSSEAQRAYPYDVDCPSNKKII